MLFILLLILSHRFSVETFLNLHLLTLIYKVKVLLSRDQLPGISSRIYYSIKATIPHIVTFLSIF